VTPQLPLRIGFTHRARLDNFIIGGNGELVDTLGRWLAGEIHATVVYLWGSRGSGRSHLLSAACEVAEQKGRSFAYLPLDSADSLPAASLDGLERRELVCLDDLDAVAGRADWEEALFHLFNRLRDADGHLLVSAACGPAALPLALEDLRSRLTWGLTYHLAALDDEGKRTLLRQQATERGLQLSTEAADYLLSRCPRDTAALITLMDRLDLAALAAQRRLTIPFLRTQLEGGTD
jgi:DnaA family protein